MTPTEMAQALSTYRQSLLTNDLAKATILFRKVAEIYLEQYKKRERAAR